MFSIDVVDVFIGHNHRVRPDPQGRVEERPELPAPTQLPLTSWPAFAQSPTEEKAEPLSLSLVSPSLLLLHSLDLFAL